MRMTLLNMVCSSFFEVCPLDAVHACPEGVPSRPTPKASGRDLWKGTTSLPRGRSPHLKGSESLEGERASAGRGCFERGTLNANRKAN